MPAASLTNTLTNYAARAGGQVSTQPVSPAIEFNPATQTLGNQAQNTGSRAETVFDATAPVPLTVDQQAQQSQNQRTANTAAISSIAGIGGITGLGSANTVGNAAVGGLLSAEQPAFNPFDFSGLGQSTTNDINGITAEQVGESAYVNSREDVQSKYGFNGQLVRANSNNPDQTSAQLTRQKLDFNRRFYTPLLEDNATDRLQDTSIVDSARENADFGFNNLIAQKRRNAGRFNTRGSQPNAIDADFSNDAALERSLNFDNTVNNSRSQLQDRNTGFRNDLLNIFNGIDSSSQQGLIAASRNQAALEAANKQADQQDKAQTTSTIASIATIAALIY